MLPPLKAAASSAASRKRSESAVPTPPPRPRRQNRSRLRPSPRKRPNRRWPPPSLRRCRPLLPRRSTPTRLRSQPPSRCSSPASRIPPRAAERCPAPRRWFPATRSTAASPRCAEPACAVLNRCSASRDGFDRINRRVACPLRNSRSLAGFARRLRLDRQSVQLAGEFFREQGVDHAMAFDPALAVERRRHDVDAEMGLAAMAVPFVALVKM